MTLSARLTPPTAPTAAAAPGYRTTTEKGEPLPQFEGYLERRHLGQRLLPASQPTSQLSSGHGAVAWAQARELVLPLASCTVLAKSLHLSEAQFFPKSGEKKSYLTRQFPVVSVSKKKRIHVQRLMQWQVPSRDRVKVKLRKPKLRALSRVQAPPEALGVALAILFLSFFCIIRNHTIRNHISFRFHKSPSCLTPFSVLSKSLPCTEMPSLARQSYDEL